MWAVRRSGGSDFSLLNLSGGRFNGDENTTMKQLRPTSSSKNKRPFAISSIGRQPQSNNWPAAKISRIDVNASYSSIIMVCQVNRKKLNCQNIFNLFSCYGTVLKVKFLRHKKVCMVEMKSGAEVGIVYKYLNRFMAFGLSLKLEHQFRASSLSYDPINDFSVSCGGDSFVNFSDSNSSSRALKRNPEYPSKELNFSGMSTEFTNDQMEKLLFKTAKDGPLPIRITRYRPRAGRTFNGFMTFKSTEQATEAIMLYNFAPILDSHVLNLYYRNV